MNEKFERTKQLLGEIADLARTAPGSERHRGRLAETEGPQAETEGPQAEKRWCAQGVSE